ncbi:adenylate/guanylate cyclase domain-containing protein [Xenophilus arseniciresistens]|uniref:Adenylate/guanylate cyclase domain-containing protein n=1 Tax=Xenophilus arseniciresistens TaxID=1283306 RepID=A0AAE3N7P3_9BURK|nr:adenylate/guanylate cyclase domain-containing protein [Xenophilus arseniciresistens]MDA7414779.1 adenylate/guanylate cyclase domain-containing protein [Xenophilus arseniciresistens]
MTTTVVFADLTGSTRVFEAMGNVRATQTVTEITQWMAHVCESHGGRVIKKLGDGVLVVFENGLGAVNAVLEIQRGHDKRLQAWPLALRMGIQIGVASGQVMEVEGDCYGDAVNVASRLSDLAGPGQIWATDAVIAQLARTQVLHCYLGAIQVRGRQDAPVVYRVDWQEESSDLLTQPGELATLLPGHADSGFGQIELAWLDVRSLFKVQQLPIVLGRVGDVDFLVNDPRVSRVHLRLESRNGHCVLVDLSTYGTWVRFRGNAGAADTEIALRREECVLHGSGEIALGAPLSDFTAPTIGFRLGGGRLELAPAARFLGRRR